MALNEKYNHVRGELKRARARIAELEAEQAPKPAGYEHLSWPTIRAIGETCSTQASRAGQSQDEVFTEKGTP